MRGGFPHLSLGDPGLGFGAPDRRVLRREALVEVDGIHLAEHLAGRDPVAHLHVDAKDAPRDGRADPVGVAGLDRSDPEERRRDGPALDLGDGDRDRRQGAGPERDPDEEDEERPQDGDEGRRAAAEGERAHRDLRIPRR